MITLKGLVSNKRYFSGTISPAIWDTPFEQNLFSEEDKNKVENCVSALPRALKKTDSIYFTKGSLFPRKKLTEYDYKRTVKLEKADFVVIPNNIDFGYKYYINEYKTEDNSFFLRPYETLYLNDILYGINNIINNRALFGFKPVTLLQHDGYTIYKKQTEDTIITILEAIKQGKTIISDAILETLLPAEERNFTPETFLDLYQMLSSKDQNTITLGIKILGTYNIVKYKYAIKFLLESLSEDNFYFIKRSSVYKYITSIVPIFHRGSSVINISENFTAEERLIIKPLYIKLFNGYIDKCMNVLKHSLPKLNLSFKYTISETEPSYE